MRTEKENMQRCKYQVALCGLAARRWQVLRKVVIYLGANSEKRNDPRLGTNIRAQI